MVCTMQNILKMFQNLAFHIHVSSNHTDEMSKLSSEISWMILSKIIQETISFIVD